MSAVDRRGSAVHQPAHGGSDVLELRHRLDEVRGSGPSSRVSSRRRSGRSGTCASQSSAIASRIEPARVVDRQDVRDRVSGGSARVTSACVSSSACRTSRASTAGARCCGPAVRVAHARPARDERSSLLGELHPRALEVALRGPPGGREPGRRVRPGANRAYGGVAPEDVAAQEAQDRRTPRCLHSSGARWVPAGIALAPSALSIAATRAVGPVLREPYYARDRGLRQHAEQPFRVGSDQRSQSPHRCAVNGPRASWCTREEPLARPAGR